jgi:O-antigen ligase
VRGLITSISLLLTTIFLLRFLWVRVQENEERGPMKPVSFIVLSVIILVFALVLSSWIGFELLPLHLALSAGIFTSLLHPTFAVGFFMANLLVRPWEMLPLIAPLQYLPRFLACLCVASWFFYSIKNHRYELWWDRATMLFCLLLLWVFIAAFKTDDILTGLSNYFSASFPIVVLCVLVLNAPKSKRDTHALQTTFVLSVVGLVAIALWTTVFEPTKLGEGRLEAPGIFGNANDLAALIVSALALSFGLFFKGGFYLSRGSIGLGIVGVLLTGLWMSKSRGGVIALGCMAAVYFLFLTRGARRVIPIVIASCFIPLLLLGIIQREDDDLSGSRESRLNYATTGFRMLRANPVLGVGLFNYPKYYDQFTSSFFEYGSRTAHSSWILLMAETGLPGLFLLIALFLSVWWMAWKTRKDHPELILLLVGYGINMSLLSHSYLFLPYLVFSLILASARIAIRSRSLHDS